MDRVLLFNQLARVAGVLRQAGLGRLVDVARIPFERGVGEFTVEADGLKMTGVLALHGPYIEEVRDETREATMARLFREAVRPGDVVVDIGAHLGWFTLQAARLVGPAGRVVSFEPNPRTRPLLERNIRDNGFGDRVTVVPYAAGARAGRLEFFVSSGGDTSSIHRQADEDEGVEVDVVTADSQLADLAPPTVIKIDVEGAEVEALAGLGDTVGRAGPRLRAFVECNPPALRKAGTSRDRLWRALEECGLEPRVIDEDARDLRGREALHGVTGYVNLLCVPRAAPELP